MSFLPRLHFRSVVGHYLIMGSVHWRPGQLQHIVAAENPINYRSSNSLVYFQIEVPVDFQAVEKEQE